MKILEMGCLSFTGKMKFKETFLVNNTSAEKT